MYKRLPFESHFVFRIDAERATWNEADKNWVLHNTKKVTWKAQGPHRVENFKRYTIKESIDPPSHLIMSQGDIEELRLEESLKIVNTLKIAHKRWEDAYIEAYANKYSGLFGTVLIVLVGSAMSQFHFRKNLFLTSLFKSLGVFFFVYFICFKVSISLSKVSLIFPTVSLG